MTNPNQAPDIMQIQPDDYAGESSNDLLAQPDQQETQQALMNILSAEAWLKKPLPKPKRYSFPIQHDRTEVKLRGEPLSPIWWRGRQWAVTEYGIERLNGTYFIEANDLNGSLPDHSWPEHMAEKRWVDLEDFITAWLIAIALHSAKIPKQQIYTAIHRIRIYKDDDTDN